MIAQINSPITKQNFEIIRNQIGAVLLCEFLNQINNYGGDVNVIPDKVWIERFSQIDSDEFPCITVRLDKGSYINQDGQTKDLSGNAVGTYKYFIDIYTGHQSESGVDGDTAATVNLHRLLGICRAILEDVRYQDLGLGTDFGIWNTHVENFFINLPVIVNASDYICGRLVFSVTCSESIEVTQSMPQSINLSLININIGLENSNDGILWQIINPIATENNYILTDESGNILINDNL